MAEDNRAVAESSASWNLQGGVGLHLCDRGLQLSPYEESGDSSDVSRGRGVLAGSQGRNESTGHQMQPQPFTNQKITETGEHLSTAVHFSAACCRDSLLGLRSSILFACDVCVLCQI